MRFHTILTLVAAASALPTTTEEQLNTTTQDFTSRSGQFYIPTIFVPSTPSWLVRAKEPGCHSGMNWWIFQAPLSDATPSQTRIAVGSPWNLGHNRAVWNLLVKRVGLIAHTDKELKKDEHCYWKPVRKTNVVRKMGVPLAYIDFHAPHFNRLGKDPKPSQLEYHRPTEDLINQIEETISLTYPWREITLLVVMTVLLPLILLFIAGAVCCGGKRMGRKHRH